LLEVYIELMTGINVAEYNFHLGPIPTPVEPAFVQTCVQQTVQQAANASQANASTSSTNTSSSGGVLFSTTSNKASTPTRGGPPGATQRRPMLSNAAGTAGNAGTTATFRGAQQGTPQAVPLQQQASKGNVASNLNLLRAKDIPSIVSSLQAMSSFSQTLSSVSAPESLNQYVLVPKQFERVFNIIVDGRDFEVDYAATTATPFGTAALNLAIANGDIIPNPNQPGAATGTMNAIINSLSPTMPAGSEVGYPQNAQPNNVNNYVDRTKNQNDGVVDVYYVTIETFDENAPTTSTLPSTTQLRTNS